MSPSASGTLTPPPSHQPAHERLLAHRNDRLQPRPPPPAPQAEQQLERIGRVLTGGMTLEELRMELGLPTADLAAIAPQVKADHAMLEGMRPGPAGAAPEGEGEGEEEDREEERREEIRE